MKTYGEADARRIAEAHRLEPYLDLTVKSDPDKWAERLGGIVLLTGSVRTIASGAIDALPGFADGEWWVQDAAAALPARLLGDVAGKRVADLCAAPGGKTASLCRPALTSPPSTSPRRASSASTPTFPASASAPTPSPPTC